MSTREKRLVVGLKDLLHFETVLQNNVASNSTNFCVAQSVVLSYDYIPYENEGRMACITAKTK
jgi:hypothetical protein